ERFGMDTGASAAQREVRAPMPGLVLQVLVAPGDAVEEGQGLVVLEAMKMENELRAPAAGTVAAVHVAPGVAVGKNALLMEMEGGGWRAAGRPGPTFQPEARPPVAPAPMILVTGATGFLGATLVRRLVAEGAPVRILRRSSSAL